jgi:hypothetical protein
MTAAQPGEGAPGHASAEDEQKQCSWGRARPQVVKRLALLRTEMLELDPTRTCWPRVGGPWCVRDFVLIVGTGDGFFGGPHLSSPVQQLKRSRDKHANKHVHRTARSGEFRRHANTQCRRGQDAFLHLF